MQSNGFANRPVRHLLDKFSQFNVVHLMLVKYLLNYQPTIHCRPSLSRQVTWLASVQIDAQVKRMQILVVSRDLDSHSSIYAVAPI